MLSAQQATNISVKPTTGLSTKHNSKRIFLPPAFSEKHLTVSNLAANKLLPRPWNPKTETIVDYMHEMGVSENVASYVLEAQNHIVSSFDISKLESKEQDMGQVVANIVSNMDKLEAKAEQDKSLSESEVIAVLVATTATKSLASAIVDVTTDFFTNLNVNTLRNQATSRSWWGQVFRAYFNVVVTIIYRAFIAPAVTIVRTFESFGLLFSSDPDGFARTFGNIIDGIIDSFSHYNCYLPDDGWQCQ